MDDFDRFMTALEDLGIINGWTDFKNNKGDDTNEQNRNLRHERE